MPNFSAFMAVNEEDWDTPEEDNVQEEEVQEDEN